MKPTIFPHRRTVPALAGSIAAIGAVLALAFSGGHAAQGHERAAEHAHKGHFHGAGHNKAASARELALHDDMRKLWEDHVTWTRLAIVSFLADLPDFERTAGRLLANQDDIGAAIAPYYGQQAGARLTGLLKEHIAGAVDLLKAARAGDEAGLARAKDAWYRNGDEIAGFLSHANPRNWPLAAMRAMMRTHLDQTIEEATARLSGDFAADVRAYDEIHRHILVMADALSAGIVKQFPGRFR